MKLVKMKSGDEYDGLTRWKNYLHWRPGERKKIKKIHNRKIRRDGDLALHRLHTTQYEDLCM